MTLRSIWLLLVLLTFPSLSAHDLVNLHTFAPGIQIDMRYAGYLNGFGYPIYSRKECYVVREVAEKLYCVQRELEKRGYGLKVFDAYRPYRLQKLFSGSNGVCGEIVTHFYEVEDFQGHNRGTAVDVTLVCLSDGCLAMPTEFGFYGQCTPRDYEDLPPHIYHNKQLLEKMMGQYGFFSSPGEWWHFDYRGYACYPILDIPFDELAKYSTDLIPKF